MSAALGLNPQAISNAMLGIRNAQIGMPGLRMKYTFEGFVSAKLASFATRWYSCLRAASLPRNIGDAEELHQLCAILVVHVQQGTQV